MGRLKAETAEQHAVAEAKPLEAALIGGSIAHDQYKEYLAQRWLIHRELEAATDRVLDEDQRLSGLGLPGLYQTANLEADLAHLGIDTATIKPLKGSENLIGTIYHQMGIDPNKELVAFGTRPIEIVKDVEIMKSLIG
jgi:hypothetical protein